MVEELTKLTRTLLHQTHCIQFLAWPLWHNIRYELNDPKLNCKKIVMKRLMVISWTYLYVMLGGIRAYDYQ